MAALFSVPGWTVPVAPVHEKSKKRKRLPAEDSDKINLAAVNMEKLMKKLKDGSGAADDTRSRKKKTKHAPSRAPPVEETGAREQKGAVTEPTGSGRRKEKQARKDGEKRAGKQRRKSSAVPSTSTVKTQESSKQRYPSQQDAKLTALQSEMKQSLDGARFRWINEELYKSDSDRAHKMMRADPGIFAEYHKGFRHQVEAWPSNPVSHYISALSAYPPSTVIADLGCGDAALARALISKGFAVLSFDLVSDGVFVTEADIFGRLPLPGSEDDGDTGDSGLGHGQVVDVVICALSLMGTNWPNAIREAWRVLRSGGELKIAEVASRFSNVAEFNSFISSFGFKLKSSDDSNTHFTLFEFKKVARKGEKDWGTLLSRGDILKPCEYKRR
ncbi:hypothetical protein BV25DRAFT_1792756 [Artomyces pyxidatus]|uniref:Uncharacterized protein n=1 Tax=Artomyces pyxidatus TaxID=48021 RepID=A0ACB8TKE2_9AGAM|nr:hypothetical protein BV25DRAFT_1792756 [Artomyces pyxidatus]